MGSPALGGVESLKWNENSIYLLGKTRRFRRLPGVHWHHFPNVNLKMYPDLSWCVTWLGCFKSRLICVLRTGGAATKNRAQTQFEGGAQTHGIPRSTLLRECYCRETRNRPCR